MKKNNVFLKYQIKVLIKGTSCKSNIAIFAWRIPWNYANSPFKTAQTQTKWKLD